jgi:hypothetical protein
MKLNRQKHAYRHCFGISIFSSEDIVMSSLDKKNFSIFLLPSNSEQSTRIGINDENATVICKGHNFYKINFIFNREGIRKLQKLPLNRNFFNTYGQKFGG